MDVSLLCSNAGFSVDAKRKAKRLGIGLIGILREGDTRIRYRIMDEIYIRRIDVVPQSTGFTFVFENPPPPRDDLRIEEILYDGVPVINWLIRRVLIFLGSNPVVRGIHSLRFRFKHPMDFALPSGQAIANNIGVQFEISGQWIAQSIEIDATCGLYDWMHQTIRMGPGQTKITYKDVKFGEGGTSIAFPPDFDPDAPTKDYAGNEVSLWIVDIGGLDTPEDIPQMDEFVMDEDLELVHRDLRPETLPFMVRVARIFYAGVGFSAFFVRSWPIRDNAVNLGKVRCPDSAQSCGTAMMRRKAAVRLGRSQSRLSVIERDDLCLSGCGGPLPPSLTFSPK